MNLKELVPPPEVCVKIPIGEFKDSFAVYLITTVNMDKPLGISKQSFELMSRAGAEIFLHSKCEAHELRAICPAPTLQEILEELHKLQEDVFLKWSETAYNEWLVNAYTHNVNDYQAHDKNPATAALKVWLELKGIEYVE